MESKIEIGKMFGNTLRRERNIAAVTQEMLAFKSGLGVRYIQKLEAGNNLPGILTIFTLARSLNLEPQSLLGDAWKVYLKSAEEMSLLMET